MAELLTSTFIISLLHALIPSHWMPIVTLSKILKWDHGKTIRTTIIASLAHCLSTILLGVAIAFSGKLISQEVETFTEIVAPVILAVLGLWIIIKHSRHKHFHLHLDENLPVENQKKLLFTILLAMFLSPCLEIEALFVSAGAQSWWLVWAMSLTYLVVTTIGMVLWMSLALRGLKRLNSHKIEHNAGLISGIVLILTGAVSYFLH
ncbi:MAG TPA: hypothetical protein VD905_16085 [Flavobacteriales bacterium]|nr:hypothetical protein [Flavobacteriales bacterium]